MTIDTAARAAASLLAALAFAGCNHSHDAAGGHEGEHGGHEGEHGGHEGGHGGHDDHGGGEDELPGQSATIWTERTELFVEHAPFVVGQESTFAAHVTELPSFRAVTAGAFRVTVTLADGTAWTHRVDAPARPGIFRPAITPTKAGACTMAVEVDAPGLRDAFPVGPCVVHADVAAAREALAGEEDPPGRIGYLKEQQWKTDFATEPVASRPLQASVRAPGELRAMAGRDVRLTAPVAGRVVLPTPAPVPGMAVAEGQLLATVEPRVVVDGDRGTVEAEERVRRAELKAAKAELERTEKLLAEGAIAERRAVEARVRVEVARAELASASSRLRVHREGATRSGPAAPGAWEVRSPIAGTLAALDVATGQPVDEGQALFAVVDLARLWLVANVYEADLVRVEGATGAWFEVEGHPAPYEVADLAGRLVTIAPTVDPVARTVAVIFELDNPGQRLRIGQFARVAIHAGEPRTALAVPEAALLDDGGQRVAFVMVEGEAFERRPLRLGLRAKGYVEVLEGLAEGERVVTRGAYEVKLAGASGAIPSHGHVH